MIQKRIREGKELEQPVASPPIAPIVARRLNHLLSRKQVTIGQLSLLSGMDELLLGRIASGEVEPTVDLLWKIANALGVRLGSLLSFSKTPEFALTRAADTKRFVSRSGAFVSRALSPFQCGRPVEFYGITLAPGGYQTFEAHAPRTVENITVHAGSIEIVAGREPAQRLDAGDWIQFLADVPHSYRNVGQEDAIIYLVMSYWLPQGN